MKEHATVARIDKDKEASRRDGPWLSTIWGDGTKLEGGQDKATLDAAINLL